MKSKHAESNTNRKSNNKGKVSESAKEQQTTVKRYNALAVMSFYSVCLFAICCCLLNLTRLLVCCLFSALFFFILSNSALSLRALDSVRERMGERVHAAHTGG